LGCFYSFDARAQVTSDADGTINELTIADDQSAIVDLQFDFPFFGQTFTRSHMHTNGVVSFTATDVSTPTFHWCCDGIDLQSATITVNTYNYAIAVFWTDLIQADGKAKLYTQGSDQFQRYMWKGLDEFDTNNANSVGLEIRPDGSFDMHHDYMELTDHSYTIAIMGDVTQGQLHQFDHGSGTAEQPYVFGSAFEDTRITGWSPNGTQYSYQNGSTTGLTNTTTDTGGGGGGGGDVVTQEPADPCDSDPLYSSSCAGYEQAYYNQQCSQNALYDSGCPGYAEAYYDQQCSLDALYDTGCPGYAEAYYAQQCSLDALYDSGCPGYAEAVIAQNCSVDPLFSPTCDGYQDALAATLLEEEEEVVAVEEEEPAVEVTEEVVPDAQQDATQVVSVAEDVTAVVEVEGLPNVTTVVPELPVVDVQTVAVLERRLELQTEVRMQTQEALAEQQEQVVAEIEQELVEELEEEEVSAPARDEPEVGAEPDRDKSTDEVENQKEAEGKDQQPEKKVEEKPKKKEQRKLQKVRKLIAKRSQNLAERMGESAALEQQKQLQLNVIAVMSYVPGFKNYTGVQLQDKPFYNQQQMPGGEVVDNRRVSRYLLNDAKFNQLEQQQYTGRVEGKR
tara:strand:+ start:798 stop:2654 length:1857 start_codon:yes stop_codon:yes gene_type:complete